MTSALALSTRQPSGSGFGSVYVATRTAAGSGDVERVAVKRLLPSVAPHRVLNELEQLARSAEGAGYAVPALLDAYRDPGGFVVVMEYFAHDDWKAYYDQLTWHVVGQYMRELLAALAHVHARGVVFDPGRRPLGRGRDDLDRPRVPAGSDDGRVSWSSRRRNAPASSRR